MKEGNEAVAAFSLSLSAGIRKIIALAPVYAMKPSILLLDEPTTSQDYPGKERIGKLISEIAASGCTVVVITHDTLRFFATFWLHPILT